MSDTLKMSWIRFLKYFLGGGFAAATIFACLLLGALLSLFSLHVLRNGTEDVSENEKVFKYQSLEINPDTNEIFFGITTLLDSIDSDNGMFSQKENGNYVLLSNFEYDEYQCTGSCTCLSNQRRSSISMGKGLFYLVAASSSIVAMHRAKEYFHEECHRQMSESCDNPDSIESDVDSCNFVILDSEEGGNDEIKGSKKYICEGSCISRDQLFPGMNIPEQSKQKILDDLEEAGNDFGCETLTLNQEIYLGKEELSNLLPPQQKKLAKTKYLGGLKKYCSKMGNKLFEDEVKKLEEGFLEQKTIPGPRPGEQIDVDEFLGTMFGAFRKSGNPCVEVDSRGMNPSVVCRETPF